MQLRQVQRSGAVAGAAPGVGVVVALMARTSCSDGALLLRARLVPCARRRGRRTIASGSGELEKLSDAGRCAKVLYLGRTNSEIASELLSDRARCARCATANSRSFASCPSLPHELGLEVRETAALIPRERAVSGPAQAVTGQSSRREEKEELVLGLPADSHLRVPRRLGVRHVGMPRPAHAQAPTYRLRRHLLLSYNRPFHRFRLRRRGRRLPQELI